MSASFINGYVINKIEYQDNDEIILILTESGKKISCISLGSRKVNSKNGRNLFVGNFCTFELFLAREKNKISKLKKCSTIRQIQWSIQISNWFNILCECIIKSSSEGKKLFYFFEFILKLYKTKKYSEKKLILILLHKFCLVEGLNLEVNKCVLCGNKIVKTISFKNMGMICNECFKKIKPQVNYSLHFSKLIFYLFNSKYSKIDEFLNEFDLAIKLILIFIKDNAGIQLFSNYY